MTWTRISNDAHHGHMGGWWAVILKQDGALHLGFEGLGGGMVFVSRPDTRRGLAQLKRHAEMAGRMVAK